MTLIELILLAVGLSMDAFSVAVCKGLALRRVRPRHMIIVGAWFGGFQALMPLIGYFVGERFAERIARYDHWIILILLSFIGINMIREALSGEEEEADAALSVKPMLLLAIATSIDALAVGVTFAFLEVRALPAAAFIGLVTFALSAAGVKIGSLFGLRYKAKAEICGGVILILLGVKILLEHLEIL
ncbi:MAG: manganese efflux pump [Clostridia bacterium]|nr:manganese efflux pump [Clostridia bacterium]